MPLQIMAPVSRIRSIWTPDIEEKLVELWREHECLYNVSCKQYHDRMQKEKSWAAMAKALRQNVSVVKTRVNSLRTQYTRLLKSKPKPRGGIMMTSKQRWILDSLDFLRPHVTSRPPENILGPLKDNLQSKDTASDMDGPCEDDYSGIFHSTLTSEDAERPRTEGEPPGASSPEASYEFGREPPSSSSALRVLKSSVLKKKAWGRKRGAPQGFEQESLAIMRDVSAAATMLSQRQSSPYYNLGLHWCLEIDRLSDVESQRNLRHFISTVIFEAQSRDYFPSPFSVPSPFSEPAMGAPLAEPENRRSGEM